jgi:hypothetical protein
MKTVMLLFTLCLAVPAGLNAQSWNKTSFFIHSGVAYPQKPLVFCANWNKGLIYGAGANLPLNKYFALQGALSYDNFGLIAGGRSAAMVEGGAISILTISTGFKFFFIPIPFKIRPYLTAGFGYLRLSRSDMEIHSYGNHLLVKFIPESNVGVMAGCGAEFEIAPGSAFFADLNYGIGFTETKIEYAPIRVGVVFR